MEHFFITDRGQKREMNEDAGGIFYNQSMQSIAVVADGMGGHQAGEVASQLAISIVNEKWHETESVQSPVEAEKWIKTTFQLINDKIYAKSQEDEKFAGMGTTVVLSICLDEAVIVGHVGDSRAYMKHEDDFQQVTTDHSLVNELLKAGQISADQVESHPQKNVLVRAVGTDEFVHVDIITKTWQENDIVLLCSDGLSNKIDNEELAAFFKSDRSYQDLSKELIHVANERGGEDNITMIIVAHNGEVEAGDTP